MLNHLIDISLLKRNQQYALLFAGQFVSMIGTMITMVALPYQIYQLTQSSLMVGLLSLAQLLPVLFTALVGGVYADRYNRRHLVLISEGLLALGCLGLALNTHSTEPSILLLFLVSSTMAAITGLHRPAFESMVQQVVVLEDYKSLGALLSFKMSFYMIVGPAIAGLLIARFHLALVYCIDFLTFLVAYLSVFLMRKNLSLARSETQSSIIASLKEALQYASKKQELIGSYAVDFIAMVFAVPTALFPALAQSFGGAKTLGLLYAAPAVGSLIISFFSGWTNSVVSDGKAIILAACLWGATILGFGLSASLPWALLFLALSGAFDCISGIFRMSLWNHVIPQEKRGRFVGIEMVSYLSGPRLGDARAGLVASYLGNTTAITSGGILCILGVLLCCRCLPKFWNYRNT